MAKKKSAPAKRPTTKTFTKKKITAAFVVKAKKRAGPKPILKKAAKKVIKKARPASGVPEYLKAAALDVLSERKAEAIVTFDVRGRSAMADYVIIATGRSGRQLAAIADYLRAAFEKLGVRKIRAEGLPQGDWVLVDAGDVIVHLFRPEVRKFYNIEEIWKKSRAFSE